MMVNTSLESENPGANLRTASSGDVVAISYARKNLVDDSEMRSVCGYEGARLCHGSNDANLSKDS